MVWEYVTPIVGAILGVLGAYAKYGPKISKALTKINALKTIFMEVDDAATMLKSIYTKLEAAYVDQNVTEEEFKPIWDEMLSKKEVFFKVYNAGIVLVKDP